MHTLFTAVRDYLDEAGWSYRSDPDEPLLSLKHSNRFGRWDWFVHAVERPPLLEVASICPLNVPTHRRIEAIEFVVRMNDSISVGHFALQVDNGALLFRTALGMDGSEFEPWLLQHLIEANLATMGESLPWLVRVLFCNMSVAAAVRGFWDSGDY